MRGRFSTPGAVGAANLAVVAAALGVLATGAATATSPGTPEKAAAGGATTRAYVPAAAPTGRPGSRATRAAPASMQKPNGEATTPGMTVIADAIDALDAQQSFRLALTATDDKVPVSLDLTEVKGVGETATIVQGSSRIQLVIIGRVVYVSGNEAALGAAAKKVGGKYVRLTAASAEGRKLAALVDVRGLVGRLLDPTGGALKVTTGNAVGRPVVVVTDSDGSRLYVSATGPPLPLLATGTPAAPGSAVFSDFGGVFHLAAPPAGQVFSR